jgi:putative sterol carrier protein
MPSFTDVKDIFENMCTQFQADKAQNDNATIQFDITGENGGKWWVQVANGSCNVEAGDAPTAADMTLSASTEDYLDMINGVLKPMDAFMKGKVRVKGNMTLAMKLQAWFRM